MAKQGSISIVDSFDDMKNTFFPAYAWKNKTLWESLDPLGKILRKDLRPNTFPHFTLVHCTRQSQWNELFTLLMNIFSVQLNMSSVQKNKFRKCSVNNCTFMETRVKMFPVNKWAYSWKNMEHGRTSEPIPWTVDAFSEHRIQEHIQRTNERN